MIKNTGTVFMIGAMAMFTKDFGWMTSDMDRVNFYSITKSNMTVIGKTGKK